MYIGLQLYGAIAKWHGELFDLLKGAKSIGIDRVEPCISLDGESENPSIWSMEKFAEVHSFLKEIGLEVISAHVTSKNLNTSIPEIIKLVHLYGFKHIVVGMPELRETAIQERAFLYRKIGEILSHYNAELLLHNGRSDIAVKIHGYSAYQHMVYMCLNKIGFQLDTGWCARGGMNPINVFHKNGLKIKSLHFKDFDLAQKSDADTWIGNGTLDNLNYLQFCRLKGIPFFIDTHNYSDDVLGDIKKSYDYLMKLGQERDHTVSYLNVYDVQTDSVKTIQKFESVIESPFWIHGENCLVYNLDDAIYHYDLETKISTKIESGIANKCDDATENSPDEKYIWYNSAISGSMQIYRKNKDGTRVRQMTFEDDRNNWFPHVSPDGKKVVNIAYIRGQLKPEEHLPNMKVELWLMDSDGKNRKMITYFFGGQGSLNANSWSEDSRYFAFVSYDIQGI